MLIEAHELTKHFGAFTAVDGLSLNLAEGEILALLGPNGAGKTTTVRMLASILRPTSGWARVAGFDVVSEARSVRHAIGLLTESPGLYMRMNALEYLDFFGELQHMERRECRRRAEILLNRFGLGDAVRRRLGTYSKGMKQKVAIVRAMLHDPQMLFLDEPTSAMDPHSAKQVRDAIAALRTLGRTVLICTHNLPEAEMLADRIAIVRRGRIVAGGTAAELKKELLGDPLMEVRLAGPMNGLGSRLDGGLKIIDCGSNWFRYRTACPETENPALLKRLVELDQQVVTLSEVERSLEDVYMKIIEQ
jgi:ABC-2 type transport system ATP-binding protein